MSKCFIFVLLLSHLEEYLGAVLRGSRAQDGQFPWLIQFHTVSPCGGVLISPDWVLTAAQCVQYKRSSIVLYATGLNGTNTGQAVSIQVTYIYPQFQGYSKSRDYDNNIALLKLVKPFDMCDTKVRLLDIAPVRLDDDYKSCLIFGWEGNVGLSSKVYAKPIQYSRVLLNSWRVCMYMNEGNTSYRNVFCTMIEDENGIRACAGNPGSPVVCEDRYQRMVLLGIASWSNFSLDCGGLRAYLRVSVFRSWMWDLIFGHKNMEQEKTETEKNAGPCQRERYLGGMYVETDTQISRKVNNNTNRVTVGSRILPIYRQEVEQDEEDGYENSWVPVSMANRYIKNLRSSTKRTLAISTYPIIREKLESPRLNHINDYARALEPGDFRKASDWDVIHEREELLNQYREIGRKQQQLANRNDDYDVDSIAVPSQHRKIAHLDGNSIKSNFDGDRVQEETENFDILELIIPDKIDFSQSDSTGHLSAGYLTILFLIYLFFIARMFL